MTMAYSSLLDDPDIQKYLGQYGTNAADLVPEINPSFANDPDVSEFAGLLPRQPAAQSAPMQMPPPQSQAQIDSFNGLPPEPQQPLLTPVPGVPRPMYNALETSAEARSTADQSAIKAKEDELSVMREYYDSRRGELEAERDSQREELQRQNDAAARMSKEQQEIADEKDAPVDPGRYMSNIGAGGKLVSIVAAAAYGFLNPKGAERGQNPIGEMLQQNISNDIAAQRSDIANGQQRRANRLSVLTQKMGSTEAAQGRLRIELANMSDKLLDTEAKNAGASADPSSIKAMKDELGAQRAQGQAEMQRALYAMQPKPKVGVSDKASQDAKRALEMYKEGEALGMTHEERVRTLQQAGLGGYAPPEPTGKSARQQELEAKRDAQNSDQQTKRVDAAREDIKKDTRTIAEREGATVRAAKAFGLTVTKQGDKYVVSGDADEPRIGESATEKEQALGELSKADTMAMSREPSARLQDEYSALSKPPFRDALKRQFFQNKLDTLNKIRSSVEDQYDPTVLGIIKSEQGKQPAPGFTFTPRR